MPYLTLTPGRGPVDRHLAHPELALAPAWIVLGGIGVHDALSHPPLAGWALVVAVITCACVALGGLLLLAAAAAPVRRTAADRRRRMVPLSTVWAVERSGWIVGATGWASYGLLIGSRSLLVVTLAVTMLAVALLRLVALARVEEHIRGVMREGGEDG